MLLGAGIPSEAALVSQAVAGCAAGTAAQASGKVLQGKNPWEGLGAAAASSMLCGGLGATYGVHIPNVGFAGLSMGTIMTIVIVWVLIK